MTDNSKLLVVISSPYLRIFSPTGSWWIENGELDETSFQAFEGTVSLQLHQILMIRRTGQTNRVMKLPY